MYKLMQYIYSDFPDVWNKFMQYTFYYRTYQ